MKQAGIALVTALAIMVLAAVLAFGAFFSTQIEQWVTRNEVTATQAYYAAHAGLQKYKTALFQNFRWALNNITPTTAEACENILAGGIYWNRNPSDSATSFPMTFTETFPNGSRAKVTISKVRIPQGEGVPARESSIALLVESMGEYGSAKAQVQAMVILTDAGQWDYALFSGKGYGGKIAGNPAIHGGVYIEGDPNKQLPPSEPVLQITGNAGIFNSYDLSSYSGVLSRAKVGNLCASLRVRYGWVIMEGSSNLGNKNAPLVSVAVGSPDANAGANAKDLPLIYTCKGPSGNYNNCSLNNKANIYTLGRAGRFDLSNPPSFPTLGSDDCTNSNSWRCQIRAEAADKGLKVNYGNPPAITLPAGATWNNPDDPSKPPSACQTALASSTLSLNNTAIDCTYTLGGVNPAGGFRYTPGTSNNPGTLEVYGTIDLIGYDLEIAAPIVYRSYGFSQSGRGASIVVERANNAGGNIQIKGSIRPDASQGKFPEQVLGLAAERNILQWKNTEVFASLYAGNEYRMSEKGGGAQTMLVGNVIADKFCVSDDKKMDEATCVPGGSADLYFVDTGVNKPAAFAKISSDQKPTYQIVMYERK